MSEKPLSDDILDTFKKYLPFLSVYSIVISGLYLLGFWSHFDINIFQYIDISGIVKISVVPLLIASSGMILIFWFGYILFPEDSNLIIPPRPEVGILKKIDVIFIFLESYDKEILIVWMLGTISILFFSFEWKWDVIPALIAMPIYSIFFRKEYILKGSFGSLITRNILMAFVIFFVPLSFSYGLKEARKVKQGISYTYVISSGDEKNIFNNVDIGLKLRYIAQINEYSFFYDPKTDAVSVSKLRPGDQLILKYHADHLSRLQRIRSNWNDIVARFH